MKKCVYAGIDLGGTYIKYGLVEKHGRAFVKSSVRTAATRRAILNQFLAILDELRDGALSAGLSFQSVGIGSPGHVDPIKGKVVSGSPNVNQWCGTDMKGLVESRRAVRVYADNDANAMALAEHCFGAGKGYTSGLYLTVGTGLGSGIVLENRIWRGSRFAGAELGHTIICKDGTDCQCGKRGCLERYTNAASFIEYYGKPVPEGAGAKYVFDRARIGDRRAIAAVRRSADYLACGIGSALEMLNPEVVVIGGGVAHGGKLYLDAIREYLPLYTSRAAFRSVRLRLARLGNDAGLIGAALLPLENELLRNK